MSFLGATTKDRPYIDVYINNYELHIPNWLWHARPCASTRAGQPDVWISQQLCITNFELWIIWTVTRAPRYIFSHTLTNQPWAGIATVVTVGKHTVERLSKQVMVGNRRRRLATVAWYKCEIINGKCEINRSSTILYNP